MSEIRVDSELCDGCGMCITLCPAFVLELIKGKVKVVNPEACLGVRARQFCTKCVETEEACMGCVTCVRNCPTAAIEITV